VGEEAGSRSYVKTKILGAMKEAKPGNLHYIFLQAYVNEPFISMPKLLGNIPDKIPLLYPVNSRLAPTAPSTLR
jgi:hypothetical protein